MKSMMQFLPKIGYLCALLVWFSACGQEAGPLPDPGPTSEEVGVDEQALGLKSGHFFLNGIAYQWLNDHASALAPAGLNINEVNYGEMFADHPNVGRLDSYQSLYGTSDLNIIDPETQKGGWSTGLRDELSDAEIYHKNCGVENCYMISVKFVKDPNLFLRFQFTYPKSDLSGQSATLLPVEGAVHYMNEKWGYAQSGSTNARLYFSNIRGLEFFTGLFDMAQKFWENNKTFPNPKLTDLTYVSTPGQVFLHGGDLPLSCLTDLVFNLPPIYIGGNPFINSTSGGASWPIWVPKNIGYGMSELTLNEMPKSNRVSAHYLGWALHMIQDILVIFHANNEIGDLHSLFEDACPDFMPPNLAPKVNSFTIPSSEIPRFSDIFSDIDRFKARLPEICENYTHYFHQAWQEYTYQEVNQLALSVAKKYNDYKKGKTTSFMNSLTIAEAGLVEKMADDQLKFTILAMACLQQKNTKQLSRPQPTPFETEVVSCQSGSLVNGIRCWGGYCRIVNLQCLSDTNPSVVFESSYWTSKFSEEGASTGNNYRLCNDGEFLTGVDCVGDYCDNISILCTKVKNAYHGNCYWADRISEEVGANIYFADGYYAAGLKCEGSNCDYKRIYACQNPMLSKPTVYAPSGATTNKSMYVWAAVPNATDYNLLEMNTSTWESTNTLYSALEAGCTDGTGTCFVQRATPFPDLAPVSWWVQPINWWAGNGRYTSDMKSFTVYTTLPAKPTLVSPSPSGPVKVATPTYTWNVVSNAATYTLYVKDSNGNNKIVQTYSPTIANCASATCSVTPTTNLTSGSWSWQIAANNPVGMTSSNALAFTAVIPPGKPTLLSPSGTVNTQTPTFNWAPATNAVWYKLNICNAERVCNMLPGYLVTPVMANCTKSTDTCSYTLITPLIDGPATWFVSAIGADNLESNTSNSMAFTVSTGKAKLSSPSGNIYTQTLKPTYTWWAVPGSTNYLLKVSDTTSSYKVATVVTPTQASCATQSTCSFTPDIALAEGAATWQIATYNSSGLRAWSDTMSFNVIRQLDKATLLSPSGLTYTNKPVFYWKALPNATGYYLAVVNSSTKLLDDVILTPTGCKNGICSYTLTTALPAGAASWSITAWSAAGQISLSDSMSFTVSP
jgi:hypothetical protein